MTKEEYERFKKEYLKIFRNRYKIKNSRKELKRTVFENNNLNEFQKKDFWRLVENKKLLNDDKELKEIIKEVK